MKQKCSLLTILMVLGLFFSCFPAHATVDVNPVLSADCNGFVITGTYTWWENKRIIGFCVDYEVMFQNAEESKTITGTTEFAIPEGTPDGGNIDFSIPVSWSQEFCGQGYTATAHIDLRRHNDWASACQPWIEWHNYDFDYDGLIDCPCDYGCTLTFGYWKTHSEFGPAPYDATWAQVLPGGASSTFFLSGQSYHEVLWTAPKKGSAYYKLAHQYIAAVLNQKNGASATEEVNTALEAAEAFFGTHTPASVLLPSVKKSINELASVLASYNEGDIGPGHCN
jgi:hypothetical protein